MLISDLAFFLIWWIVLFSLGIIFLPLNSLLFQSFFDKGYAFSKILGILLISYAVWLIASLKILPFNYLLILGVIIFFFAVNLIIQIRQNLLSTVLKQKKIIIAEELLFLGGFLFWSFIKAHEPSIHGLEKFMDFGFINSILRSDYFPPKDLWLAPHTINYYYFGHYVAALLIKLSRITPEIGYNLMLASLFGLTLSASFSIGSNLYYFFSIHSKILNTKYQILSGLLGAFLVTLGGNLHTIYIFFQNYMTENPVPFWQLPGKLNLDGYWYPNATRFIPFTIHEFPLYSFVVSDLHGHVFDIPFVLLLIALLIIMFQSVKPISYHFLLISLLIAVFLMTNFLDGPIYLLVIFICLFAKSASWRTIITPFYQISLILLGAIIFSLPYWISFTPFGSGIGVLCAPTFLTKIGHLGPFLFEANHCARSPWWMLLILWGFPLFIVFSFLIKLLPPNIKSLPSTIYPLREASHLPPIDKLVITLSLAAFVLILIPEFFYVKDIYPAHYRANTVFKFGYQAFIILGLTSGYILTRIIAFKKLSIFYLLPSIFLFFFVAIYPYFAVNSYFSGLKNYQGLNGLSWLESSYAADYQVITWIKNNISGQPVILEAQGDSYTDFARVSSNTGLPTIIGWPVHEWLWRGSYDEAGKRSTEVTTLYESPDLKLTQDLLKKYQVGYVFIGALERQKYHNLNEDKFNSLGQIIFQSGDTKIYRLYPLQ